MTGSPSFQSSTHGGTVAEFQCASLTSLYLIRRLPHDLLIYPLPGSVGDTSSQPDEVASSGSKMPIFFFLSVVFWILDHFNVS